MFARLFRFSCLALLVGSGLAVRAEPARNPVIHADVPDIAVVRVGGDYYMSSTTMHLAPGLPLMKSTDLANWKLVSYAYETLADNEALRLENGRHAYGAGSWASSLRFHDGVFYASTFSATTGRTHVYATRDPERGPWRESSFAPALHDHTLFFDDDGRAYMIHGAGEIGLIELNADASGPKPGGLRQVIIPDASRVAGDNIGLKAEGSQLMKVDGKYYLFHITWPKGGMRTQLVHRADRITGPYEGRVILQDRGIAQGSIVDTADGKWYAYLFRDFGAVGRIPYLVPMTWRDGWPVLGNDGKVPETLAEISAGTQGGSGVAGIVASDEFDRAPGERPLPLAWQWNHNPDPRHWSLAARPGFLRLTTGRVDAELVQARNTLTQRTFGPRSSATAKLDASGLRDGDYAGLVALQRNYGFVGVKRAGGALSVVMVGAESGQPVEIASVPLAGPTVHLRIDCDYRDRADRAHFFHSLDGERWLPLGPPLAMKYTLPLHFMGYRFGLFNFATQTPGGHADFDYYRVSGGE